MTVQRIDEQKMINRWSRIEAIKTYNSDKELYEETRVLIAKSDDWHWENKDIPISELNSMADEELHMRSEEFKADKKDNAWIYERNALTEGQGWE